MTLYIFNSFEDLLVPYEQLQFKELIGHGTFGQVHRGEWCSKEVALKRITVPAGEDKYSIIINNQEIAALKLEYALIRTMLFHPDMYCQVS